LSRHAENFDPILSCIGGSNCEVTEVKSSHSIKCKTSAGEVGSTKIVVSVGVRLATIDNVEFNFVESGWKEIKQDTQSSVRDRHAAVWANNRMILWGGNVAGTISKSGVSYDLTKNSWAKISAENAPEARRNPIACWIPDAGKMIVWGGEDQNGVRLKTGGAYDPILDSWTAIAEFPLQIVSPSVCLSNGVVAWGGDENTIDQRGAIYDASGDSWTEVSQESAPESRRHHSMTASASGLFVWGGVNGSELLNSGGIYDFESKTWSSVALPNAPIAREGAAAAWGAEKIVVWGGRTSSEISSGAAFDPEKNVWSSLARDSSPAGCYLPSYVSGDSGFLIFGGGSFQRCSARAHYDIKQNAWSKLDGSDAPAARTDHSMVWNGASLMIWGGKESSSSLGNGWIYDDLQTAPLGFDLAVLDPHRLWDGQRRVHSPRGRGVDCLARQRKLDAIGKDTDRNSNFQA
jgi:N-acetylneuraminic acid mutarotase